MLSSIKNGYCNRTISITYICSSLRNIYGVLNHILYDHVSDQCRSHFVVYELVQRRWQFDDAHQHERRHVGLKVAQGDFGRGQTADRVWISASNHTFRLVLYNNAIVHFQ